MTESEKDRLQEVERQLKDMESLFLKREGTMEFLTRAIRALTLVVVKTSKEMEVMLSVTPPNIRVHILQNSQVDPSADTEIVVEDGEGKVSFVLATREQMEKLAQQMAQKLVDPKTGRPFAGGDTGARRVEVERE